MNILPVTVIAVEPVGDRLKLLDCCCVVVTDELELD